MGLPIVPGGDIEATDFTGERYRRYACIGFNGYLATDNAHKDLHLGGGSAVMLRNDENAEHKYIQNVEVPHLCTVTDMIFVCWRGGAGAVVKAELFLISGGAVTLVSTCTAVGTSGGETVTDTFSQSIDVSNNGLFILVTLDPDNANVNHAGGAEVRLDFDITDPRP